MLFFSKMVSEEAVLHFILDEQKHCRVSLNQALCVCHLLESVAI